MRSQRSPNEKRPWKDLPDLIGSVERQFVRPVHLGDTVLPFRELPPRLGIIPWDGQRLLDGGDDRLNLYPGLATWWRHAEQLWETHRVSAAMSLLDRIDYQRTLQNQFPAAAHRVVYSASGMYLAAARVADSTAVIEHKLYWASTADVNEARYLIAVLNSQALLDLVRPLQSRGEHNPRDFDKYVFKVPFPLFSPDNPSHNRLAALAERAEAVAAAVELPAVSFQAQRRRIREALELDGVGKEIDDQVRDILPPPPPG